MNYKKQKRIQIEKIEQIKHTKGDNGMFLPSLKWEPFKNILADLSHTALIVYLYFLSWELKGEVFFSPTAIEKEFGISKQGARDGLRELITKGYCIETIHDNFLFIPVPPQREKPRA